ncbi:MAG: hypothetical protein Q3976_06330 [Corynebacterium sp.]|nr:hypothetical protein [Corynebacterium sp.]
MTTLSTLVAGSLLLSGCVTAEKTDDLAASMGDASPVATADSTNPAGMVLPYGEITDMELTADVVAIRSGDTLNFYNATALADLSSPDTAGKTTAANELAAAQLHSETLASECADITAFAGTFVAACENKIYFFPADDPSNVSSLELADRATTAVLLSTGELITAADDNTTLRVIKDWEAGSDDYKVSEITTEKPTDQLLASSLEGAPDRVVRINRENTIIQDIHWADQEAGGILRMGKGVGQIASGPQGMILAADSIGNQTGLYSTDEVIRLHQLSPVAGHPWDAAWDSANEWAWVSATEAGVLNGYDISRGTFVEQASFDAIADAQNFVITNDGVIVAGSASGGGLQVIAQKS